ncbi:MAG: ribonuclease P protein component [Flexilinea sp.]|nr:ribonuclease P protein component [Flexilinea sp.]
MERKDRLNRTLDIQRVRRYGKSIAHPFFVLIFLRDKDTQNAPVGIIASKAVGGAVERNRAKRVLRSAASALHDRIRPDCMLLLIARQAVLDHDTPEITEILSNQLKKADLLREQAQE